ncbi:MAG: helix-turn-helix transcriptional regulator [Deltaproteobacteria bacterium]|nr:helix-turn-helix transcriptional regulator [Deltaproteobacteria bacterium]
MDYQALPPSPELRRFVRCYWAASDVGSNEAPADTVVPDGCAEIIVNVGAPMVQVEGDASHTQPRILLVGEVRQPVKVRPAGNVDLFGIRLTPVGLRTLLRVPAFELVDRAFDVMDVADQRLRTGLLRLGSALPRMRPKLADELLLGMISSHRQLDTLVWRVADTMESSDGRCNVSELAAKGGITVRQLERRFLLQVGIPPRALMSVLRFRRVLASLDARMPAWAHVAASCGYHDQSHLIRDFKRYTGMSPRAFLGDAHPFGDLFLPDRS